MISFDLNYWAVLAAALVDPILGGIWFNPKVFGTLFREQHGMSEEEGKANRKKGGLISIAATLVSAWVMGVVMLAFGVSTVAEGLLGGFLVWLGFLLTGALQDVAFVTPKWKLFFMNATFKLIVFLSMGVIFALLQ